MLNMQVEVVLNRDNNAYILVISDNGRQKLQRKDNQYLGTGLKIMEYRAKMIKGKISIDLSSPQSTKLKCIFPLQLLSKTD